MIEEKFAALAKRLTEKTVADELDWEEDSVESTKFVAALPDYSVAISYDEKDGMYRLDLLNRAGGVIESMSSARLRPWPNAFEDLSTLHQAARRKAFKVEEAVDSLLRTL